MCYKLTLCDLGIALQRAVEAADLAIEIAGEQCADDATIEVLALASEEASRKLAGHWARKCQSSHMHLTECKHANPLCKWRKRQARNRAQACRCDAYTFPHRKGSRACRAGVPWILLKSMPAAERAQYETAKADEEVPF